MTILDQALDKVEALKQKAIQRSKLNVRDKMYWRGVYDACKDMQTNL